MKIDKTDIQRKVSTIINNYNLLESILNKIICEYFSPQKNAKVFQEILLNSAIIGMGLKIKILNNINDFDSSIIKDIRNINSIRNGIVHNNTITSVNIYNSEIKHQFTLMNSQGKLVEKNFETEYDNFRNIFTRVYKYLKDYENKKIAL